MPTAKGYLSKASYKRESNTTWGNPVATSLLLPFTSEGIQKQKEFIKDDYLVGYAGYERLDTIKITASGSLSLEMIYTGLEELLLCALGHEHWGSVLDLGNGFYVHTIEPDDDLETRSWRTNEGITTTTGINTADKKVRRFTLVIDKQVSGHQYISCFVNSLTIQGQAGDKITVDADLISYDRKLIAVDSSTWTLPENSNFKRVLFPDLTFKINGVNVDISEFNLQINNNLTQTQANDLHLEEPVRNGKREITFSFKIPRYATDQFLNDFDLDNEINAVLTFTSPEGYAIDIELTKLKYTNAQANAGGEDIIPQNFSFLALATDTQKEIYIKLTNKISIELWRL